MSTNIEKSYYYDVNVVQLIFIILYYLKDNKFIIYKQMKLIYKSYFHIINLNIMFYINLSKSIYNIFLF